MANELTRLLMRSQLRASDEEREGAVESLRHHYAAGRLSSDELEERIGGAYAAATRGDLDALMIDLPSGRRRRTAERMRRANRAAMRAHATSFAGVNTGLVALWGVTGGGEFWPGWTIGPWGFALAWHWMACRAVDGKLTRGRRRRELRAARTERALPR